MSETWYQRGYEAVTEYERERATMFGPNRFFLSAGQTRKIVFVDDEPFNIYEHNPTIDGKIGNSITCLAGVHDRITCCESFGSISPKYFVGYYSVIDATQLEGDKVKYQYEQKFLPAKTATSKKFKTRKEEKGSLIGKLYTVRRSNPKSPSVGEEFEFDKDVNMDALFEHATYKGKRLAELFDKAEQSTEDMETLKHTFQLQFGTDGKLIRKVVPFNYMSLLAPKSPTELKNFLAGKRVTGWGAPAQAMAPTGTADESVPF